MLALGRLLRLSLAPSALADVAAGVVLAHGGRWPAGAAPFVLMASSACVYHGALALNDWRDREHDARTRPGRPIPSGSVRARTALLLGLSLLALGPAVALLHTPSAALWSLALALLAAAYDLFGRGPLLGPALLATCRAGNLGLGLLCAGASVASLSSWRLALPPLLLYGMYVWRVSQLGRLEDGEDSALRPGRARALLLSACLMLALVPCLAWFRGVPWNEGGAVLSAAIAWTGAFGLARAALAPGEWTRARVERSMGVALRRLLVFSAALAALAWRRPDWDAFAVAALILSGFALSAFLRRWFPPS